MQHVFLRAASKAINASIVRYEEAKVDDLTLVRLRQVKHETLRFMR
jgi:hypothetical protein